MKRKLLLLPLLLLLLTLASGRLPAQGPAPAKGGDTLTFTFAPGSDLFTLRGNEAQLARLSSLIDRYRSAITTRRMPLRIDGYCASLPTRAANLRTAYLRATRVKSELITRKGLTEAHFITGNYAPPCNGRRDIVVVTLRIPDGAAIPDDSVILSKAKNLKPQGSEPERLPSVRQDKGKDKEPRSAEPEMLRSVQPDKGQGTPLYRFALRTNLLYDALLLPTLGIEWRINRNAGVRLGGSLSRWGGSTGKVQKVWLVSPEVRWYLLRDRRFYIGASGNYGEYNLYGYPLGSLLRDDTGYQGTLWSAGLTAGYQLPLWRCLSADFSLGLGYTRSAYDSFTVTNGVRVIRQRGRKKNLWGPTQAGITLVWTIGGKKQ